MVLSLLPSSEMTSPLPFPTDEERERRLCEYLPDRRLSSANGARVGDANEEVAESFARILATSSVDIPMLILGSSIPSAT